jgi:hypothetical protein
LQARSQYNLALLVPDIKVRLVGTLEAVVGSSRGTVGLKMKFPHEGNPRIDIVAPRSVSINLDDTPALPNNSNNRIDKTLGLFGYS